jgi:hypothetical protein
MEYYQKFNTLTGLAMAAFFSLLVNGFLTIALAHLMALIVLGVLEFVAMRDRR